MSTTTNNVAVSNRIFLGAEPYVVPQGQTPQEFFTNSMLPHYSHLNGSEVVAINDTPNLFGGIDYKIVPKLGSKGLN